ncbi:MAG: Veg family protein [Bacillota bacterium]|nr:Veg family protein [Bacillota bacterium]
MAVEKKVTIEDIRQQLESNVGKKVFIRANKGRRRYLETEGVLVETYPKLFVVNLDQTNAVRRRSYTYADVLTQNVQITIDDKQVGAH